MSRSGLPLLWPVERFGNIGVFKFFSRGRMRIKCKKWEKEMKVTTERVIDNSYWLVTASLDLRSWNGNEEN